MLVCISYQWDLGIPWCGSDFVIPPPHSSGGLHECSMWSAAVCYHEPSWSSVLPLDCPLPSCWVGSFSLSLSDCVQLLWLWHLNVRGMCIYSLMRCVWSSPSLSVCLSVCLSEIARGRSGNRTPTRNGTKEDHNRQELNNIDSMCLANMIYKDLIILFTI